MSVFKFNKKRTKDLKMDKIPYHLAIIMDGNGRWAQKRGLPRSAGHKAGVDALREAIKSCLELKIKILSVFAFSTENWKRPQEEINVLMNLLTRHLISEQEELNKHGVRINCIGCIKKLPTEAQKAIEKAEKLTKNNRDLILNIALNYGGRLEILEATKKITQNVLDGSLIIEDINEKLFSSYLFTQGQPDPDLLIRPSGEKRLSNFFLWQTAYTEIYTTNVLWPDFRKPHLIDALLDFQMRDRRFGGIKV